jgi:hypothetical protein
MKKIYFLAPYPSAVLDIELFPTQTELELGMLIVVKMLAKDVIHQWR